MQWLPMYHVTIRAGSEFGTTVSWCPRLKSCEDVAASFRWKSVSKPLQKVTSGSTHDNSLLRRCCKVVPSYTDMFQRYGCPRKVLQARRSVAYNRLLIFTFFCVRSLSTMHITVVECHWGQVILTSARIGSPGQGEFLLSLWLGTIEAKWFWLQPELEAHGPGRFPYSHCGWPPLRPSGSDFSQNWKPMDRGDSPTLIVVGHHWGHVIQTSATIGSPGPGRAP
jgi:hypothetical protein